MERLSRAAPALYSGTTLDILMISHASIYLVLNLLTMAVLNGPLPGAGPRGTACGPHACLGAGVVMQRFIVVRSLLASIVEGEAIH